MTWRPGEDWPEGCPWEGDPVVEVLAVDDHGWWRTPTGKVQANVITEILRAVREAAARDLDTTGGA